MPGWVWVLLVLFLIAVLIAGAVFVFLRGKAALGLLAPLGHRAQKDMAAIQEAQDQPAPERKQVVLGRPLADVREDYEDAHTDLLRHKNRRKAERDAARWPRWAAFGTQDEQKDDPQVRRG